METYRIIYKKITLYRIEYYVGAVLNTETRKVVHTTKAMSEQGIRQLLQNKIRLIKYLDKKKNQEDVWF